MCAPPGQGGSFVQGKRPIWRPALESNQALINSLTESGRLGVQAAALEVGKKLGALCKEKGISTVVFDRGGFMYHGRIAVSPSPGRLFPLV
jgi:hypothetical protein